MNVLLYQILLYPLHGKTKKTLAKAINLKYQLYHGMKNLNQILQIILRISI